MADSAWRKIRTIAWFMYGDPGAFLSHIDEMAWLIMNVSFDS